MVHFSFASSTPGTDSLNDEMAPPMYFRDEADEGEESVEENESGSEEEGEMGPTGVPLTNRSKKAIKICRHFSYALIYNAVDMGWEEQEVANLIKLVANQLSFDEAKLIRCLEKTSTGSPGTIACLLENSEYSFSAAQMVSVILSNARNVDHFITLMGEAFECSLFDLAQPETIDTLYSFVGNNMDYRESQRYARQLCEHSASKRLCGRVLHKFTSGLTSSEAAAYMYDIITLDFFQDIRGSTKDLMKEIPRAQEQLEALLNASHNLDKDGEIIDSDADSEGNLRDFVVNSDSDEGSDGGESESGSGSGSESDGPSRSRRSHSSNSESGASDRDSDRDADLSEEENSRNKPTKATAKKSIGGSAKPSASKSKGSDQKSQSKLNKTKSSKMQVESEEEDWGSDSSHHGESSSGSDQSSRSQSSASSHSLPSKPTKNTANNAVKASSQALKRKRIQDDSSDESETEREGGSGAANNAKKLKTGSTASSSTSTSTSNSTVSKASKNVVKTEKRIVLSDSEDSSSGIDVAVKKEVNAERDSGSESSSGSSDSAGSSDSDSDSSSGSESIPPPSAKKVSSAVAASKHCAKSTPSSVSGSSNSSKSVTIKVEPATKMADKVKAEGGASKRTEPVVVKQEIVIKREKEVKKEKKSKGSE